MSRKGCKKCTKIKACKIIIILILIAFFSIYSCFHCEKKLSMTVGKNICSKRHCLCSCVNGHGYTLMTNGYRWPEIVNFITEQPPRPLYQLFLRKNRGSGLGKKN